MQASVLTLVATLFLAIDPPEDNKYTSENLATSVRLPAADYLRTTIPAKTKSADKEVLSADDVKKIEDKKDKEVSVKGTVNEVFLPKSGSIAILNFGKDSKKCFKAVVFKGDFEKFEGGAEGIKKKYTGKTVTVEGKVSMYQGTPQIAVKTPSQFKIN